ncbi:MAG: pyrroline-5-carboxylate reductase [Oscillospiraceae bacterium]|nr:pyrroline-5-carboxylate reductase [Oscillospiraceae bacterium]
MKTGIIGTGNIANAIIGGSKLKTEPGLLRPEFWVYDVFPEKACECAEKHGVSAAESADEIAGSMEAVVLAVKPKDMPKLLSDIGDALKSNPNKPLLISVAAGLSIEYIESLLSFRLPVARIMTNINASIGGAMTAYCLNDLAEPRHEEFMREFCSLIGDAVKLDEAYFSQFSVMAGCVPAFAYMFVEELARAGVKIGVSKELSLRIAAQTVLGSAKLVAQGGAHPYELIDRVCTPGGTTIEGIRALQEHGFPAAVMDAVVSSYEKDQKLAGMKK